MHSSELHLILPAPILPMILMCLAASAATLGLTLKIRDLAHVRGLLDTPNERSSHREPTPRGGGLSFVATISAGLVGALLMGWLPATWAISLFFAGGATAAVGWIDDHGHVPAPIRLAIHIVAAVILTALIGPLSLSWTGLNSVVADWTVSVLLLVWIVNLVNFMDGIDGIAASEVVSVAFGLALCLVGAALVHPTIPLALLVGAAASGFLILNWAPASIFMGDVGSGFLGIMLGGLILVAHQLNWTAVAAVLILLAVFMADASVTLVHRALHGHAFWTAHRSHAYQNLARRWSSHRRVTLSVIFLNGFYLLPLAFTVIRGWVHPVSGLALAYVPLCTLVLVAGAGLPEREKAG